MSRQVSQGSAGDYTADERASVVGLSWRRWLRLWRMGSRAQASLAAAHVLSSCGAQASAAPRHVQSSRTWDPIHVPCIGVQVLLHCTTRVIPSVKSLVLKISFPTPKIIYILFPSIFVIFFCIKKVHPFARCTAHGTLLSVMWQPGWEGSLGENRYMYMYG